MSDWLKHAKALRILRDNYEDAEINLQQFIDKFALFFGAEKSDLGSIESQAAELESAIARCIVDDLLEGGEAE